MQLSNEIHIARPPAEVFDALLDVERVAECMPGSTLTGKTAEDTYGGEVKVKVGPLTAAYSGTVRYAEVDRENRRIVLNASGKEASGQGNAEAHVVATVASGTGDGTNVAIETDLTIRGKVAQFGRGVIGEVSQRLIGQFAGNVESLLTSGAAGMSDTSTPQQSGAGGTVGASAATAGAATADAGSTRRAPAASGNTAGSAVDGMGLVLLPVLKRGAPYAATALAGLLLGLTLRRRGKRSGGDIALRLPEHTAYLLMPLSDQGRSGTE